MSNLVIDLTNYRDTEGDRLPAGNYLVRVSDTELTESKAGNPMVNLFLEVIKGETTGDEFAGSALVDRVTITPKAMFRVVAFLKAIGAPTDKRSHSVNPASWIGKLGVVSVEDGDSYNGRPPRTEVRAWQHIRSHGWVDGAVAGAATAPGSGSLSDLIDGLDEEESGTYDADGTYVPQPVEGDAWATGPAGALDAEIPGDYDQQDQAPAETAPAVNTLAGDDEIDLDELDLDGQG